MSHPNPTHDRTAHRRPTARTRLAAVALAALCVAAGCANDRAKAKPPALDVDLVAALQPFDRCEDFLSYVKAQALDQVTAYGLGGGMYYADDVMTSDAAVPTARSSDGFTTIAGEASKSAGSPATTTASADTAAGSDTGTNNQEAGVDEADLVKVDGDRIVTMRNNELVVVTMTAGAPYVTARVNLGDNFSGDRLLLLPDRAYVLGTDNTPMPMSSSSSRYGGMTSYLGRSEIVEVSLSGEPVVAHRTSVDGTIVDGRLANGAVRLVLTTPGGTGLGFVYPSGNDERSIATAEATNRTVVENSKLEDWLPTAALDAGTRSPLLDCDHLFRPAEMSGFSMLSILTIADGLGSLTGSGVLADGQITYASTDHLYVATNQYEAPVLPDGAVAKRAPGSTAQHTDVHSFSIAGREPAAYQASGRVDGHVLNQYSMSEAGGDLRIATTLDGEPTVGIGGGVASPTPACPPDADCAITETTETTVAPTPGDSRVVVLRRSGEALQEIGKVDGLGVGEQIKSVRYVGDIAYVVTFRRTDPFYVIDLSDPTAPKKLGELKVPGFSSYLHPVGDHLVLGVGSDAGDTGGVTGAKLSLYDTSDPVNPKELANVTPESVDFMTSYDPHAFHWDAERSTAYLPYNSYCSDTASCARPTSGVMVVRITDGKIEIVGTIDHRDRTPSPTPPTTTVPETTVPETTVPETTVPDTTTATEPTVTTAPATTVPDTTTTTVAERGSTGSAGASSSIAVGEPAPIPVDPGIGCDPASCDDLPSPADYQPTITRVFVIGDRVITLSDAGLAAHDVATLKLTGFATF